MSAAARLSDQTEAPAAKALEDLVAGQGFAELLGKAAENVFAVTKIFSDVGDLTLRNLRLAGRADLGRLARQLNRNEDKLERVLQEVELLRDELRAAAKKAST